MSRRLTQNPVVIIFVSRFFLFVKDYPFARFSQTARPNQPSFLGERVSNTSQTIFFFSAWREEQMYTLSSSSKLSKEINGHRCYWEGERRTSSFLPHYDILRGVSSSSPVWKMKKMSLFFAFSLSLSPLD